MKMENKQNKNKHFNFRVNEKEYNVIKTKIEKSKLNTSKYLLRTAMDKDIIVIDGLEEIIIQLRKIGNNINQLAKLSNQGRLTNVNLEDVKEEMKNAINGGIKEEKSNRYSRRTTNNTNTNNNEIYATRSRILVVLNGQKKRKKIKINTMNN